MNAKPPQRWIKSPLGTWPTNSQEEFLLPKGERQDEGEPRSMTQRRVNFSPALEQRTQLICHV